MDIINGFNFCVNIAAVSMGFKSVSGISRKIEIYTYCEGGINDRVHIFPKPASSENVLTLEKGAAAGVYNPFYMVGEPLEVPVILTVLSGIIPAKTYTFTDCIVKSWSVSGMDAMSSSLLIDRFEVVYGSFIVV